MNIFTIRTLFGEKRHGVKWSSGESQNNRVVTYCGIAFWGLDIVGIVTCQNCLKSHGYQELIESGKTPTIRKGT